MKHKIKTSHHGVEEDFLVKLEVDKQINAVNSKTNDGP